MSKTHPVITETGLVQRYLSEKYVRASVVDLTQLVAAACKMQKTSPSSSVALGRILVGTALLASHTKERHEVAVQMNCDGPLGTLFAHGGYDGNLRGTVAGKNTPMSLVEGVFSLKPLVKGGTLSVTTYIPNSKKPARSQLEIVSGEVGDDLAHYLHQSMQIRSLLSLGVKIGGEGQVVAAGGVLVELMPGYQEDAVETIEKAHNNSDTLSDLVEAKAPLTEWLSNHVGDLPMSLLSQNEIRYCCTCEREKARASIELLGLEDIKGLVAKSETLEVNCDMCGLVYALTQEEMNLALKNLSAPKVH